MEKEFLLIFRENKRINLLLLLRIWFAGWGEGKGLIDQ
jgi:hypothetical protein